MEIDKHTSTKVIDKLKIIYDNDVAIIDFLSDLNDRRGIRMLDEFVRDSKGLRGACLLDELTDAVFVLILYGDPFGFNKEDNKMVMYADTSLRNLAKYFKNQLDHTSPDAGDIYKAINDITRLLYWRWCESQDNEAQINSLG